VNVCKSCRCPKERLERAHDRGKLRMPKHKEKTQAKQIEIEEGKSTFEHSLLF
jgi:hypothetical protein